MVQFANKLRRRKPERAPCDDADATLAAQITLAMGGWVSDHAVIDRQMNTLHVFTGLEISAIPAARKRLLRAVAS